jgi:hemerythrin-like metal-binding protein
MPLMTWNNKYSVGVEALDHQHKAFMKVLNELHAAAIRGQAHEVAGRLFRQLSSGSSEHFSAEERLMESIRFPGLAGHRARHGEFTAKLADFASRHGKGDSTVYTPMLYFARDWLTTHILDEDQQYVRWLSGHGNGK